MKRLPPNWANKLTCADVDEILAHFREQEQSCRHGTATLPAWPEQVPLMISRIALWTRVRAAKMEGLPVQHMLNNARRTA